MKREVVFPQDFAAGRLATRLIHGVARTWYWFGMGVGTSLSALDVLIHQVAHAGLDVSRWSDGLLIAGLAGLAGACMLITVWEYRRYCQARDALARYVEDAT